MTNLKLDLPFWEGFLVSNWERRSGARWITLAHDPTVMPVCSGCSHSYCQVHERAGRTMPDMPILGDPMWLQVPLRRLRCPDCGPRIERVDWLDRHARVARRLSEFVGLWCEKLAVAHVCKLSSLQGEAGRVFDIPCTLGSSKGSTTASR